MTDTSDAVSRETLGRYLAEDQFDQLAVYGAILADEGVTRGLIGPKEVPRLWQRHLNNCAVVALDSAIVPPNATVVDVGTGAGLPGIVWSIVRPDLQITLVESLLRRTDFLVGAVADLGLAERVAIWRGRAEECSERADVVTARAVAPLPRLLPWLAPLTVVGGQIVAFKGENAQADVASAGDVSHLGLARPEVHDVVLEDAGAGHPALSARCVIAQRISGG